MLTKSETYQRVQVVSEWVIDEEDIQQVPNPSGAMHRLELGKDSIINNM